MNRGKMNNDKKFFSAAESARFGCGGRIDSSRFSVSFVLIYRDSAVLPQDGKQEIHVFRSQFFREKSL